MVKEGTFGGAFPIPVPSCTQFLYARMAECKGPARRPYGRDTSFEESPEKKAITNCFDILCRNLDLKQILPTLVAKRVVSMTRCKELQAAAITDVIGANSDLVIAIADVPEKVHAFCEALLCETATEHIGVQLREGMSTCV